MKAQEHTWGSGLVPAHATPWLGDPAAGLGRGMTAGGMTGLDWNWRQANFPAMSERGDGWNPWNFFSFLFVAVDFLRTGDLPPCVLFLFPTPHFSLSLYRSLCTTIPPTHLPIHALCLFSARTPVAFAPRHLHTPDSTTARYLQQPTAQHGREALRHLQ